MSYDELEYMENKVKVKTSINNTNIDDSLISNGVYNEDWYETEEEVLQNFLLDIDCLDELNPWTSKLNIFDVLKVSRIEIRHSNMLAWLLNPNENHGLGELFIKGIIQRIVENEYVGKFNIFKLLLMDFYSFIIYREWKNIDLLIVSVDDRILIAVENKIASSEHSDQLNRYRNILENEYPDYQRIYIYLTPDGEEPSDVSNWSTLTYTDIVDILEVIVSRIELLPDAEIIIKNYLDILRRDIVEDIKLIEICNKIYSKHKKALDLIYEHRVDERSQIADVFKRVLKEQAEKTDIIFDATLSANNYIKFNTKFLDQYLRPLDEKNSSWNTQQIYYYWINIKEDRFRIVLEVGGWNIPDNLMGNMQKIINILKSEDKNKSNFKYKRLYSTKRYLIDDSNNIEEDIERKTLLALNEIIKLEDRLKSELLM